MPEGPDASVPPSDQLTEKPRRRNGCDFKGDLSGRWPLRFIRHYHQGVGTKQIGLSTEDIARVAGVPHHYIVEACHNFSLRAKRSGNEPHYKGDMGPVPPDLCDVKKSQYHGSRRACAPHYYNIRILRDPRFLKVALKLQRVEVIDFVWGEARKWCAAAFPGERVVGATPKVLRIPGGEAVRPVSAKATPKAAPAIDPDECFGLDDVEPAPRQPEPEIIPPEVKDDAPEASFVPVLYEPFQGRSARLGWDKDNDTIWATQRQMADGFGVDVSTINRHWNNILKAGELDRDSAIAVFAITAAEGKRYPTVHGNLDMICAIGYRVGSKEGNAFRRWATGILKSHLKGEPAAAAAFDAGSFLREFGTMLLNQQRALAGENREFMMAMLRQQAPAQANNVVPLRKRREGEVSVSDFVTRFNIYCRPKISRSDLFNKLHSENLFERDHAGRWRATEEAVASGFFINAETDIGKRSTGEAFESARFTPEGSEHYVKKILDENWLSAHPAAAGQREMNLGREI